MIPKTGTLGRFHSYYYEYILRTVGNAKFIRGKGKTQIETKVEDRKNLVFCISSIFETGIRDPGPEEEIRDFPRLPDYVTTLTITNKTKTKPCCDNDPKVLKDRNLNCIINEAY